MKNPTKPPKGRCPQNERSPNPSATDFTRREPQASDRRFIPPDGEEDFDPEIHTERTHWPSRK